MSASILMEMRQLDETDLAAQIVDARKALFELRLKRALEGQSAVTQMKKLKHRVSQLMTVLREKQLEQMATGGDE